MSNNTATIKKKLNVNATTQPGFCRRRKTTNPLTHNCQWSQRLRGPSQKERPRQLAKQHDDGEPQNWGTVLIICTSHTVKNRPHKNEHSGDWKTKSNNQQKDAHSLAICMALHAKLPRLLNSTFSCTNSQEQIQPNKPHSLWILR